jgi:flagellar biosynthesis protein
VSEKPAAQPKAPKASSSKPVAVALDYQWPHATAPTVVASGHGELAARIVEKAEAAGVPVRHDGDLAQVLSQVEIGEQIPLEAFTAVAEILAYLYRLNGALPTRTVEGEEI